MEVLPGRDIEYQAGIQFDFVIQVSVDFAHGAFLGGGSEIAADFLWRPAQEARSAVEVCCEVVSLIHHARNVAMLRL